MLLERGILVVIEGIDGSGKSTLVASLAQKLSAHTIPVHTTKEPGATDLGKQLRSILQTQSVPLTAQAEFLLFAADRAQHFTEIVIPQLDQKKLLLSDRMGDSSLVYQGFARGLDIEMLKAINRWVMRGITPDLVLFVQLPLDQAIERLKKRELPLSAFEQQRCFMQKLEEGFKTIYRNQEHVILIDANQSPEDMSVQAYNAILQWLKKKKLIKTTYQQNSGSAQIKTSS